MDYSVTFHTVCIQELAHTILGAGKFGICGIGQEAGNLNKSQGHSLDKFISQKTRQDFCVGETRKLFEEECLSQEKPHIFPKVFQVD